MQTFQYDALNRLLQAKETVNGQQNWLQSFTYDRYGNRTGFAQNVGGQQLTIDSNTLPDVDAATNRFETGQGYEYDYCGNLITDPQNRHFSFNADNKQAEVRDNSNALIGQYFYDAGGKRVKKIAGTETTIFVYDGMGKQIAEYSTTAVSSPTTSYVMTDTLQSVRAVSDAQGNIISRRDFLPFGEELYAGTANRTTTQGYSAIGADNIRKRFTGYEKDVETGLDFAEARYYNNQHGRFTAVDPLLASGKSANPQTFNRYAYVMNSPLRLTDHSGLQVDGSPREHVYPGGYETVDIWVSRLGDRGLEALVRQVRAAQWAQVTGDRFDNVFDTFDVSRAQREQWRQNIIGFNRQITNVRQTYTSGFIAAVGGDKVRAPDSFRVSWSAGSLGKSVTYDRHGQIFTSSLDWNPRFAFTRKGWVDPLKGKMNGPNIGPLWKGLMFFGTGISITANWNLGGPQTAAESRRFNSGSGVSFQGFYQPSRLPAGAIGAGFTFSPQSDLPPEFNVGLSLFGGTSVDFTRDGRLVSNNNFAWRPDR